MADDAWIEQLKFERDHAIDNERREREEHDELRAALIEENRRLRVALEKIANGNTDMGTRNLAMHALSLCANGQQVVEK